MIRLFIGIRIPKEFINEIKRLQSGLPDIKWARPEGLHVTLAFIGEVEAPLADEIISKLRTLTFEPFRLRIGGAGAFGGKKPRLVYLGVESDPKDALVQLHDHVQGALLGVGVELERRKYSPHMTLGRGHHLRAERVAQYLEGLAGFALPEFEVDHFDVLQSHLSHEGAHYVTLAEIPAQR